MTKPRNRPGLAYPATKPGITGNTRLSLDETDVQSHHRVAGSRLIRDSNGDLVTCRVNIGESPIGWLSRRKDPSGNPFLMAHHVEASERLRADFTRAQSTPPITQNWDAVPKDKNKAGPSESLTLGEAAVAARQRFEKAVEAMGPELADMAVRACCYLQGMEAAEQEHGWPARSGKVVLKLALDRLSNHYGLNLAGKKSKANRYWRSGAK